MRLPKQSKEQLISLHKGLKSINDKLFMQVMEQVVETTIIDTNYKERFIEGFFMLSNGSRLDFTCDFGIDFSHGHGVIKLNSLVVDYLDEAWDLIQRDLAYWLVDEVLLQVEDFSGQETEIYDYEGLTELNFF